MNNLPFSLAGVSSCSLDPSGGPISGYCFDDSQAADLPDPGQGGDSPQSYQGGHLIWPTGGLAQGIRPPVCVP